MSRLRELDDFQKVLVPGEASLGPRESIAAGAATAESLCVALLAWDAGFSFLFALDPLFLASDLSLLASAGAAEVSA